ncbi:MAG: heme biosynthesis protein HemY [Gammaproteobacteria bacterium]|nr:heme biosynthesis protein HemY [Gammaproteobacteria bacterium]
MKRIILAILLATTLSVIIGVTAFYNGAGYVVFSFAEYTVETSFIFMMGFLAIGFFVFYYFLRIVSRLLYFPNYMSQRHSNRQSERSKNALVKGLIEMSEGRFEQAEKILIKQADNSDTSLLNYLMAARSAQQIAAYDRRDEYLRLAHEVTPSADIAIGLTQAELQLSHKQFEQALATLNHLSSVSPKHGYVKKLQARTYKQLGDWDSLVPILEDVRRLKAVEEGQLEKYEVDAYLGMLKNSIKHTDGDKTEQIWQQMPKRLKNNSELIYLYSRYLYKQKKEADAEVLIRNKLSESWHDELAILYSNLTVGDCTKQLETAETWLHGQSRNAILLLVLGKLCLSCQLWGKARGYFESSIGIKPTAEAYLKLAELLDGKMDEHEEAQKLYQLGLMNAVDVQFKDNQLLIADDNKSGRPLLKVIQ